MDRSYESLNDYLSDRIAFPEQSLKRRKVEGTEVIQFDVTPEGKLTRFKVINSVSPEIDEHVISVLKNTSGFWTPGAINGEPATMTHEISVAFKQMEHEGIRPKDFSRQAIIHFEKGTQQLLIRQNPKRALKHFNKGLNYQPYEKRLLYMRGLCLKELGDEEGARRDWERMETLESRGADVTKVVYR
jgi:TonB family protein